MANKFRQSVIGPSLYRGSTVIGKKENVKGQIGIN